MGSLRTSQRGVMLGWVLACCFCWGFVARSALAQPASSPRSIVIELYVREGEPDSVAARRAVEELVEMRAGLVISVKDITSSEKHRERFDRVATYFRVNAEHTPLVYACGRVISGFRSEEDLSWRLRRILQMEVFVRHGCPRCRSARFFLSNYSRRYPGLEVIYREVSSDAQAVADMNRLVARHRARATSVPVFHLCNKLLIGFSGAAFTGARLDGILERWTIPTPPDDDRTGESRESSRKLPRFTLQINSNGQPAAFVLGMLRPSLALVAAPSEAAELVSDSHGADELDLPLPGERPPASTELSEDLALPEMMPAEPQAAPDVPEYLELPVFGKLNLHTIDLLALTLAIGLVDGFNPCAMWVLLFLLSLLVNVKDRRKIVAIAGTFVLVSGLVYFAFMAAWLNVFQLIGYLRPVQLALGATAILVGSVHIKDFFAFHRGITFSIPESAKPGIFARTRKIINAENLLAAIISVIALAVMVNIVELLCTAGLPALYTEILTMRNVSASQSYAYLVLYNVAYMFDDSLMVLVVVITLGKKKLQEQQGRWLKLISGMLIAVLGLIMIVRPELLI